MLSGALPAPCYNPQITLSMVPSARQPLCSVLIRAEDPCLSASVSTAAPREAAWKPSLPGPVRRLDARPSSAAGRLLWASPASPNRSCFVTAVPWALSSPSEKPPNLPDKPGQARVLPRFLHAGGCACLSVHSALTWFSRSGTLSLWVKGWDPLPRAQQAKHGPDVHAPPGTQSRASQLALGPGIGPLCGKMSCGPREKLGKGTVGPSPGALSPLLQPMWKRQGLRAHGLITEDQNSRFLFSYADVW